MEEEAGIGWGGAGGVLCLGAACGAPRTHGASEGLLKSAAGTFLGGWELTVVGLVSYKRTIAINASSQINGTALSHQ